MKRKISEKITQLRRDAQLTQQQLAERLNVSSAAISKWENGVSVPDIETLYAIADFFQVSMDTLLCYTSRRSRVAVFLYNCTGVHNILKVLESRGGEVAAVVSNVSELEALLASDETIKQVIELKGIKGSEYVQRRLEEMAEHSNVNWMRIEAGKSENLAPLLERALDVSPL